MKAADDFNGSDMMVDVAITLSDAKGNELAKGTATTAPLHLALTHVDKQSWVAEYKDILGPALAAVIAGMFAFIAGRKHQNHRAKNGPAPLASEG